MCEFFVPSKHLFKPFVVGIKGEETSERSEKVPGRHMDGTLYSFSGDLKRDRGGWTEGSRGKCCTYLLS